MSEIKGIEGLTYEQMYWEVQQGARFVYFQYCFSILIMSFKRSSDIYFIRPGESAIGKGAGYTILSALVGWWGFPWGLIFTVQVLATNLGGGTDVTQDVMHSLYRQISR
ncbi:MAG: hypothetical protein K1Y36_26985 [Blastocatellia bacterium]|nr:hypothetical protein [Blastocatellia bacterium]